MADKPKFSKESVTLVINMTTYKFYFRASRGRYIQGDISDEKNPVRGFTKKFDERTVFDKVPGKVDPARVAKLLNLYKSGTEFE